MKYLDLAPHYTISKDAIHKKINEVFAHGRYIMGPEVENLEQSLQKFTGAKHALACSNGTVALQMALMCLDLKPNDEVIVPAFTFFATSEAVNVVGATPVFVDIQLNDFNIDVTAIKEAITPNTKAIIPVSLYGQPANFDTINKLAKEHKITVIEDAAQSFGATYNDTKSCNLSELATTSFFPAKPLGGFGDGGAVFTNNSELYEKMKQIRDHGSESRYHHVRIGLNGRLDSLQCAFLEERLSQYPKDVEGRNKIAEIYFSELGHINNDLLELPRLNPNCKSVWAQFALRTPKRDELQKYLQTKDIPTAIHYPCALPDQPVYKNKVAHSISFKTENSNKAAQTVLCLPLYPHMPEADCKEICKEVENFFS